MKKRPAGTGLDFFLLFWEGKKFIISLSFKTLIIYPNHVWDIWWNRESIVKVYFSYNFSKLIVKNAYFIVL